MSGMFSMIGMVIGVLLAATLLALLLHFFAAILLLLRGRVSRMGSRGKGDRQRDRGQ